MNELDTTVLSSFFVFNKIFLYINLYVRKYQ